MSEPVIRMKYRSWFRELHGWARASRLHAVVFGPTPPPTRTVLVDYGRETGGGFTHPARILETHWEPTRHFACGWPIGEPSRGAVFGEPDFEDVDCVGCLDWLERRYTLAPPGGESGKEENK